MNIIMHSQRTCPLNLFHNQFLIHASLFLLFQPGEIRHDMIDRPDTETPFLPEFCSIPQQQESDNNEWLPQDAVDWQAWLRRRLRELEKQKELQEWLRRRVIRWGLQRSGAQHPEQVLQ